LLSEADVRDLADRRFEGELAGLEVHPEIKASYDQEVHKNSWYTAYRTWMMSNQSGNRPSLIAIVSNVPVAAETADTPDPNEGIFAAGTTERALGTTPVSVVLSGARVELTDNKARVALGTSLYNDYELSQNGTVLSLSKVISSGSPEQYQVEIENIGSFSLAELVAAAENLNLAMDTKIGNTNIDISLITS
jgi:hypothetical protein